MTDEEPLDLGALEPPEPTDQARAAILRFRWRVVFVTVVSIVAVAFAAMGVATVYFGQRHDISMLRDWVAGPESQIAISGGSNCKTPTYKVGYADVTVLQVLRHTNGWLLHMVVQGNGHALGTGGEPGSADVSRRASILPLVTGATSARVRIQDPGWDAGEAYVVVPGTPDQFQLQLNDPSGAEVGTIAVNMADVMC